MRKANALTAVLLAISLLVSCSHTVTPALPSAALSGQDESSAPYSETAPDSESSDAAESPAQSEEAPSVDPEPSSADPGVISDISEEIEESLVPVEVSGEISEEETSRETGTDAFTVRINEIMASSSLYFSPFGKASDWVELCNYGDSPVDITGFYLTDNDGKIKKDPPLCGVIEPHGYMLIYAGGEAFREDGVNLMGFTLSKGETVSLFSPDGVLVSSVLIPETLKKDTSYAYGGIVSGGSADEFSADGYNITAFCTPGHGNGAEGYEDYIKEKDSSLGALVIYELMTVNGEFYAQNGEYYDWVELKNVSGSAIDLSDYYLSDEADEPFEWRFPQRTLAPGKTVLVFCSGKSSLTTSKYLHASFKLGSDAERLIVTRADGTVSDSAYISDITYKGSYGRMDGESGFFYFAVPSPERSNSGGKRFVANSPVPDTVPGIYAAGEKLTVTLVGEGVIRYTLDGSEPNEKSAVYTSPFTVESSAVIRAVAYAENKLPSRIMTAEYLFCAGHDLPVVSIAADPDDLFSEERGICYGEYGDKLANFRQNWERKIHFSLYDTDGGTAFADCGIKLTGEGSRKLPEKSFQLKFRTLYGMSELDYDIFGDGSYTEFKTIKLRAGEDYPLAVFRDELTTSLAADAGMLTQKYRFCVLYINGEYYGIYCFRNKIDEYFIADSEDCDPDDVIIVDYNGSAQYGSKKPFRNMYSFVTGKDMSKAENYAEACEMIDTVSLADWISVQVYTGNRDLGNDRAYRAGDGKWKWLLYDTDWGFHEHSNAYYLLNTYKKSTANIALALLKNSDFRDLFLKRLAVITDVFFSYESVCERCDELSAIIASEIPANSARWRIAAKTWKKSVDELKTFAAVRRDEIIKQTAKRFGLSETEIKKYFG